MNEEKMKIIEELVLSKVCEEVRNQGLLDTNPDFNYSIDAKLLHDCVEMTISSNQGDDCYKLLRFKSFVIKKAFENMKWSLLEKKAFVDLKYSNINSKAFQEIKNSVAKEKNAFARLNVEGVRILVENDLFNVRRNWYQRVPQLFVSEVMQ